MRKFLYGAYTALPHTLSAVLILLILLPGKHEGGGRLPFLVFVILLEILCLIKWKSFSHKGIFSIVFGILTLWQAWTVHIADKKSFLFPPPSIVLDVILVDSKLIAGSILSSTLRLLIAFAASIVLGVAAGLVCAKVQRLHDAVMPIARIIAAIPALIYAPYAVAVHADFTKAAVFILITGLSFPIMFNTINTVKTLDHRLVVSAKTLNLSGVSMALYIFLPYSLPSLFQTLSAQVSNAFLLLIGAEMMGMTSGVGWYVKYWSDLSNYTKVLAGFVIIGILVSIINLGLAKIKKHILHWKL